MAQEKETEQVSKADKKRKLIEQIRKSESDPEVMENLRNSIHTDKSVRNHVARLVNLYEQTLNKRLDFNTGQK